MRYLVSLTAIVVVGSALAGLGVVVAGVWAQDASQAATGAILFACAAFLIWAGARIGHDRVDERKKTLFTGKDYS